MQDDMLKWTKSPLDEHELYLNKQIDGLFTEFPHLTSAAFKKFQSINHFPNATVSTDENYDKHHLGE